MRDLELARFISRKKLAATIDIDGRVVSGRPKLTLRGEPGYSSTQAMISIEANSRLTLTDFPGQVRVLVDGVFVPSEDAMLEEMFSGGSIGE